MDTFLPKSYTHLLLTDPGKFNIFTFPVRPGLLALILEKNLMYVF